MPPETKEETPAAKVGGLQINSRTINAGLAAVGVIALAAAGFVTITTPGQQEAEQMLADERVAHAQQVGELQAELADARARLELLDETKSACKEALDSLTRRRP